MEEFLDMLQNNIQKVTRIGDKIEKKEPYMEDIKEYLPSLNQMIQFIFQTIQKGELSIAFNQDFAIQVLNDILYGIEQEDSVFLLDVLRYGLLEIYEYIGSELQNGGLA